MSVLNGEKLLFPVPEERIGGYPTRPTIFVLGNLKKKSDRPSITEKKSVPPGVFSTRVGYKNKGDLPSYPEKKKKEKKVSWYKKQKHRQYK
jgi:hypothetical protein